MILNTDCDVCGNAVRAYLFSDARGVRLRIEPCTICAAQRAEAQPAQATNSAMPKPHRSVCSHCYGSAEMCGSCDNGSRFYPLCREQGVASA